MNVKALSALSAFIPQINFYAGLDCAQHDAGDRAAGDD